MIDQVLWYLFLREKGKYYENLILLQPSNPLRSIKIIKLAIKKFLDLKKHINKCN